MNIYTIESRNGKKFVVKCEKIYRKPKAGMNTYIVIENINGKKHVVKETGVKNDWR